ncbi:MAG: tetratricopeptide repeat protein [Anaerolineae bacterium]|nr:tetratricopeptide repeat protein [Anaerolineae bacterium]
MDKAPKPQKATGILARRRRRMSDERIRVWLDSLQIMASKQDPDGIIVSCRDTLRYVPPGTPEYAEALNYLAGAYMMQHDFYTAYHILTEALEITPDDPYIWYNRGFAARLSMRTGQSLRDFERAAKLEGRGKMQKQIQKALRDSRKIAKMSLATRGPGFTLDQLIEQEEFFAQGVDLMNEEKWEEAEQAFRRVIEIHDCLPQPWGNLGGCLVMQKRYDAAEAALKRALEIDPEYDLAKQNLDAMPEIRAGKTPLYGGARNLFADIEINQSGIEDD